MKNTLLVNNTLDNAKKVEKYMSNYINELKIHFGLNNKQLINILSTITLKLKKETQRKKRLNFFFNLFNKWF